MFRKIRKAVQSKTVKVVLVESIVRLSFIVLVVLATDRIVSVPNTRYIIIAAIVIAFTIVDTIAFRRLFRNEANEYLGWQLLWIYPSNQITITICLLSMGIIGLVVYVPTLGIISKENILSGIITGVIASCIIVLLSEMSNNYKNNTRRLAILNDYASVVHFYEEDINLNKEMIDREVNNGKIQIFDFELALRAIDENEKTEKTISSYTALEVQAIAWELSEYWQLLVDTLHSHSEALYLNEIKSLTNISSCVNSICTYMATSQKIAIKTAEIQRAKGISDLEYVEPSNQELSLETYLNDLSKEKNETILASLVVSLIYFDQNMKLLSQYVLYLEDKEIKHLKHLRKKVERAITVEE